MTLEERLSRQSNEDKIELGNILDRFYSSDAGTLVRAMMNGRIKEQFVAVDDTKTSADRRLGRAEGIQLLQDDIELVIQRKNNLIAPLEEGQNG